MWGLDSHPETKSRMLYQPSQAGTLSFILGGKTTC